MTNSPQNTADKVRGLRNDLGLSYRRSHEAAHEYLDSIGKSIPFENCSLWVCKNRREKLAEWDAVIEADALTTEPEGSQHG